MTTTIDRYQAVTAPVERTASPELFPELSRLRQVASDALVALGTTVELGPTITPALRAQYLRELAERSVRADAGLDRDLADEINREAWGFNGE
jgi:hypothetical protein